jgi:hypothetical protein
MESIYGLRIGTLRQNNGLEIMSYGFQGLSKHIPLSFKDNGLDHIGSNVVYKQHSTIGDY